MPSKRKRDLFDFDPNKSDSEDENFVLGADGEERPRRTKKKQKGRSHRGTSRGKKSSKYKGAYIDDDDEEISEDSGGDSFIEDDEDEDDDDDDDAPLTSTGRRARKAAVVHPSYKESTEEEESIAEATDDEDDEDDDLPKAKTKAKKAPAASPVAASESPRPSRIVTLKTRPRNLRDRGGNPPAMTRRTRGNTEEADEFVELSNSGRHARPARSSRSRSPETFAAAGGRTRRASKGLKKPPAPAIEEATQESSILPDQEEEEGKGGLIGGGDGAEESTMRNADLLDELAAEDAPGVAEAEGEAEPVEAGEGQGDAAQDAAIAAVEGDIAMNEDNDGEHEDEDEDDVMPLNRRSLRTRASGSSAKEINDTPDEAGDEGDGGIGRRLTRGSRLRKKPKSVKEPSSDFEPVDDEEGEEVESDASQGNKNANDGADDSSQNSRGRRRSTRLRSGTKRSRRDSDGEDDVDRDEVAMEAEELRASSHSRPRRRRRSPSIVYEATSRRRTTKVVDYSIKPLDQFLIEQEEEEAPEPMQTPARRRNARNGGATTTWQRNLLSTYGPFGGGGGAGSLIGGPWGTGAAGGVDSDSSDDEMNNRTALPGSLGGNVGMTPTAGTAATGFAAPLNLESITGVSANSNVGKIKNQKALADADPLGVDMTVDFSKVGGLQGHINQLKEMVTLPLLYPELFTRFKVTPPRGVLFHGPPGTGKTLLARALANSVGIGGRKITFYMRKGADALSKWVGEAEKQLRLLFEEARRTQPSIIFFDEIDGLAPVRSSKQEQIHASIVSTLLALMDGMDGRGQVIVIGATNRPDNIDPALRRPGRFDREFYFPLPDLEGRRSIIDIHTKEWNLPDSFKGLLAERSKGYGGADLRALCTEAALNAIQRTYPQIYSSEDKLIVDPEKISVHATDFALSMKRMIPSSERSAAPAWAPLPKTVEPLLSEQFGKIKEVLDDIMPHQKKTTALEEAMYEQFQDADHGFGRENMIQEFERSRTFRPRLILTGIAGMGQGYLSAAILNHFEGVHIQSFDLPVLLGDGRPLEQVIVSQFIEVKRHKPAIIFIPNVEIWYLGISEAAYITFCSMLRAISSNDPVLVLGTCECEESEIPSAVMKDLFGYSTKNRVSLERPSRESRRKYFTSFLEHATKNPSDFPDPANRKKRVLEVLPVAPPPPPKIKTKEEIKEELRKDHLLLNLLKVQLQPIMDQIKKYKKFRQPVIADTQIAYLWQEADPNYVQPDIPLENPHPFIIAKDKDGIEGLLEKATNKFYYNLDLATIEERLSNGFYSRPKDFYRDVYSLARDARNLGDKERLLKANELVTNVEVDVAEAEARLAQVNWDELYERQLKRAQAAEERAKAAEERLAKRRVGLAIVDAANDGAADEGAAPVVTSDIAQQEEEEGDEPLTEQQQMQRQARFAVKPAFAQQAISSQATSSTNGFHHASLSNGNSVPSGPSNDEDVTMTGVNFDGSTGAVATGDEAPLDPSTSTHATPGNTQFSQRSVMGFPANMSPSAIANDASTTKTSDPSPHSSGPQSTQATNGVHGSGSGAAAGAGASGGDAAVESSQIPDTQSVGQSQSTPSDWIHSQKHGLVGHKQEFDGTKTPGSAGRAGSGGLDGSFELMGSSSMSGSSPVQPLGPPPPPNPSQVRFQSQPLSQSKQEQKTEAPSGQSAQQQQSEQQQQQQQNQQNQTQQGPTQPQTQPQQQQGAGSGQSSQAFPISATNADFESTLETILDRTSGCTVDQLEQISREIMDYIWSSRNEANRAKVVGNLSSVFNRTIADIEQMQGLANFSQ